MEYGWIEINKDGYPDYGIPVLVFDETMPEEEDGFPLDKKVDVFVKADDPYDDFWCKSDKDDITHWMPLPEPPK